MATPGVFVSSTYYDLKYIGEDLKSFIRTIGYEPILSEEENVFYNPTFNTHDACVTGVPSCQIFVLIIGGRFGGRFKDTDKSITNTEYLESMKRKIPVFALVEASVYSERHVYIENIKVHGKAKSDLMAYPSVDNVKIFEFIDEVRKNAINNEIGTFKDFSDIGDYLKKQWAGMMFSFLNTLREESRAADKAKLTIKLYDTMIRFNCFRDLVYTAVKPTPKDILKAKDLKEIGHFFNVAIKPYPEPKRGEGYSILPDGSMSQASFKKNSDEFHLMKEELERIVIESGWTIEDFLKD